jgi:branched-chain amino acid transport system substrate-binding protein
LVGLVKIFSFADIRVIIVVCLFSQMACISAVAQQPPPIRIGAIYGFTGFANIWSSQARRGIELAQEEINQSGGIHGRRLEVLFEDSRTTSQGAVIAFNKLVKVDRVDAVVGDIISFVTLPLVPLAQRHNVLLITPSIFDSDLPPNSDYFFTTCPRTESMTAPVEQFFSIHRDIRTVAIICADNSWGHTYLKVWRSEAQKRNIEVVDENCISDYSSDMRAEVLRAKAKRPDALIVAFGIDRALKRMQELQFRPKVLTTSDLDEAIHSRGLPASEAQGVYFADWLATESFQSRFRKRFNHEPIMAPQNSYEAIKTLAEGFRRSEGDLQKAILSLRYEGDTGPVDYRGSRAGNRASSTLMVVSDGVIKPVGKSQSFLFQQSR